MGTRNLELEIMRYDPEKDKAPWFQSYTVPCLEDWVILDAINYVKDNLDTTLAYPLVLPHDGLRQLRHDGQWRARPDLQDIHPRIARQGAYRATGELPHRARPGGGAR